MIRAFAVTIGVALVLAVPGHAHARPRLAIASFDEDTQGELTDLIAESLESDFSVVGPRKVSRALDKLGLDSDLTGKQLKKLAAELEVESIIRGDVSKKGGHKVMHVLLFHGGKKVRGFKIEYASSHSKKFKAALKSKLLEKLGVGDDDGDEDEVADAKPAKKAKKDKPEQGDKPDKGEKAEKADKKKPKGDDGEDTETASSDEDADKPKKKAKAKDTDSDTDTADEDEDGGKKGKKTASRDEDDGAIEGEADVEAGVATSTTPHTLNRAAVRVDFGVSVSRRTLTFTSRSFEQAPKPYSNSPVPGGHVEGEIYPLAFGNPNGIVSGLGIGGEYDQTLSLNLQSTVQPGTKFPVKQSHFAIGGRLRFVIGKKPTSPSVTVKAGYTSRTFTVDRAKLMPGNIIDLPDVGYRGFDGGVDIRVPIAGPVALFASGGAIFVTTTGAIQTSAQYGQAKVTGAEGRLGVDVAIGKRMAVKLVGDFTQMGFAFTGTGQMANNRDGDPSTKDVGGAADRYLGGSALFGVAY